MVSPQHGCLQSSLCQEVALVQDDIIVIAPDFDWSRLFFYQHLSSGWLSSIYPSTCGTGGIFAFINRGVIFNWQSSHLEFICPCGYLQGCQYVWSGEGRWRKGHLRVWQSRQFVRTSRTIIRSHKLQKREEFKAVFPILNGNMSSPCVDPHSTWLNIRYTICDSPNQDIIVKCNY